MLRLCNWIRIVTDYMGYALLCILCCVTMLQVVMRYAFHYALSWPEEAGRFAFILSTYIGIIIMTRTRGHLRIDILELLLGRHTRLVLAIIQEIACLGYFGLFTYLSYDIMMRIMAIGQNAISLPIPIWIIWAMICLFTVCCVFYNVVNLYCLITGRKLELEETA